MTQTTDDKLDLAASLREFQEAAKLKETEFAQRAKEIEDAKQQLAEDVQTQQEFIEIQVKQLATFLDALKSMRKSPLLSKLKVR
jgi:hypothetical protein